MTDRCTTTVRHRAGPDRAHVWRPAESCGLELLHARYHRQDFPAHSHRRYAIGIVETGTEEVVYAGQNHLFGPGSVAIFAPGVVHSARVSSGEPVRLRVAFVEPRVFEPPCGPPRIPDPVVFDPEFATLFQRLHRQLDEERGGGGGCAGGLVEALADFTRQYAAGEPESPRPEPSVPGQLARCLRFVEQRIEEGVTVGEMAMASGLSRFQLIRRFRSTFQMTPHSYLTQLRVRRAKELLRSGLPIVEVALAAGFSDQSHLTRVFHRWVGVTPASFR